MLQHFIRHIEAHHTLFKHHNVPDRLMVKPVDMWNGNAEKGQRLCEGVFTLQGQELALHGGCWEPAAVHDEWLNYLHGFRWLRDLRAVGHAAARQQAQALIENWAGLYKKPNCFPWRADLIGERICLWISHYDFFATDAADDFDDVFFTSLYKQASYLVQCAQKLDCKKPSDIRAIKGLLYAGLSLEEREDWVALANDLLLKALDHQILKDGGHISRAPHILLQVLKLVIEIRSALQAAGYPVPSSLQDKLVKMTAAVKFFRYGDKGFGHFQSSFSRDRTHTDTVLAQCGVRSSRPNTLLDSGFSRAGLGRSLLMFDHGAAANHAAPLSFELSYGKDRVFVNCGSHEHNTNWQDLLKNAAAHNTLEISGPPIHHIYKIFDVHADIQKDYAFFQAAHDAYLVDHGLIHRRRLYLADDGHDIRGEDSLFSQVGLLQPLGFSVRFHIHPKVITSAIDDNNAVLLRLSSGVGWRFTFTGAAMHMEDSLFMEAHGHPRKTKQIVLSGDMFDNAHSVKWSLKREGL